MKIIYDSQIFRRQKFGGVSRYCAELIKGINTERDFTTFPRKFFSANKHLRSTGLTYFDFITDRFKFPGKYYIENFVRKIEDRNLVRFIKKGDFDLFHPTDYNPVLAF